MPLLEQSAGHVAHKMSSTNDTEKLIFSKPGLNWSKSGKITLVKQKL